MATTTHWNLATSPLRQEPSNLEVPNQEDRISSIPQPHAQDALPTFGHSDGQLSKSFNLPVQKQNPLARLYNGRSSIPNARPSRPATSQDNSRLSRSMVKNTSQERIGRGSSISGLSSSNSRANLSKRETPLRATSAMGLEVSRSRSPLRFSDKAVVRHDREKKAHNEGMRLGAEGFDTQIHRKTLEKQVEILENRLNKLKVEEDTMMKKIKDTTQKTDKILSCKKRRQDELMMKEMRNKKKEEDLNRKKMELLRERDENKNNLKKSKLYSFKNKHDVAYTMKVDNTYHKALKEEFKRRREDRNKELIAKVQGNNNLSASMRNTKDYIKQEDVNQKYAERIEKDKEKADLLAVKCKELERQEHQLLEKLSQTYNLHKEKIVELEKAFTMKVSAHDD